MGWFSVDMLDAKRYNKVHTGIINLIDCKVNGKHEREDSVCAQFTATQTGHLFDAGWGGDDSVCGEGDFAVQSRAVLFSGIDGPESEESQHGGEDRGY